MQDDNITIEETDYSIPLNQENYADSSKVLSNTTYYWIASRCCYCHSDFASFELCRADKKTYGIGMFRSTGINDSSYNHYLRPVVTLDSNIKVTPCTGENTITNQHTINW